MSHDKSLIEPAKQDFAGRLRGYAGYLASNYGSLSATEAQMLVSAIESAADQVEAYLSSQRTAVPDRKWPDHDQGPCESMAQCHAYAKACVQQGRLEALSGQASAVADRSKEPMEVGIKDGLLGITIGVDTLAFAMHAAPTWPVDESGNIEYQIDEPQLFAEEFLSELQREEEDGTTQVHRLFDRVGLRALENGAEGVSEVSDQAPTVGASK